MTQTLAIFLDSYRELNSRKLFWIALIISGFVVLAFALIGITETGLKIVVWDVESSMFNSTIIPKETFYKGMFVGLGIEFWLAWATTILALVSTAGIVPDLIAGGSIDLVLSKPIGRIRLYLTKFCGGLLFAGLQVTVFSLASFLVLGLRGGTWEPGVFLAIPLIILFFSYLFSICALLGLLTRSTVAALLLTLLTWFVIFGIHATESGLLMGKLASAQKVEALEARIAGYDESLARLDASTDAGALERAERTRQRKAEREADLVRAEETLDTLTLAHGITYGVKTLLPKTSETIDLLERWLIDLAELPEAEDDGSTPALITDTGQFSPDGNRIQQQVIEEIRGRSVAWIIGTSLVFEALVLAVSLVVFTRRDY